jgi:hypothetical protein
VTSARLLAETAKVKRGAAEALRRGEGDEATGMLLHQMHAMMGALLPINPEHREGAAVAERLREEIDQLDKLERGTREMAAEVACKSLMEDVMLQSRGIDDRARCKRNRSRRDF